MTKHDKREFPSDDAIRDAVKIYEDQIALLQEFAAMSRDWLAERTRYNQEHEIRLHLETKVRNRGAKMHEIEECRAFEGQTTMMLVEHLDEILKASAVGTAGYWHASRALDAYADRQGPRP